MNGAGRWGEVPLFGIVATVAMIVLLPAGIGAPPAQARAQAEQAAPAAQAQAQAEQAAPAATPAPAVNKLSEIEVDSVYAFTALVLPMHGSYAQHPEAIGKLIAYAGPKGILRGNPFGAYYRDPATVPVDSLRWEICAAVPEGTQAEAPFEVRRLPDLLAVQAVCTGPYATADTCYGSMMAWVAEHGYVLSGAVQEHWLSDPTSVRPENQEARIIIPVVKAAQGR